MMAVTGQWTKMYMQLVQGSQLQAKEWILQFFLIIKENRALGLGFIWHIEIKQSHYSEY